MFIFPTYTTTCFVVENSGAEHLMKYETRIADGNSRDTILRVEWAESGEKVGVATAIVRGDFYIIF